MLAANSLPLYCTLRTRKHCQVRVVVVVVVNDYNGLLHKPCAPLNNQRQQHENKISDFKKKKTKKVYDAAGRLVSERHVLNDAVIDRWVGRRATE